MSTYVEYCQLYWLQKKQKTVHIRPIVVYNNAIQNLFIDTSLSITCVYAYFHPQTPRPTRFPQFIFSYVTIPIYQITHTTNIYLPSHTSSY